MAETPAMGTCTHAALTFTGSLSAILALALLLVPEALALLVLAAPALARAALAHGVLRWAISQAVDPIRLLPGGSAAGAASAASTASTSMWMTWFITSPTMRSMTMVLSCAADSVFSHMLRNMITSFTVCSSAVGIDYLRASSLRSSDKASDW